MIKILAWHFFREDCRLNFGDGRKVEAGITHKIEWPWTDKNGKRWGSPSVCNAGLHGSKRIVDALKYAPGPVVWRVELSGEMDIAGYQIASSEQTYLWGYDASGVLRSFSRRCDLDVIHLWDAPDVVVRYLKTGDESIIRDVALLTAEWPVAWALAKYATRDATLEKARTEAWTAEWAKQNNRLTQMVIKSQPEIHTPTRNPMPGSD